MKEQTTDTTDKAEQWLVSKLREERLKQGYSQQEIANKLGVHRSRICDIETKRNTVKFTTAVKYIAALGVRGKDFFSDAEW